MIDTTFLMMCTFVDESLVFIFICVLLDVVLFKGEELLENSVLGDNNFDSLFVFDNIVLVKLEFINKFHGWVVA
jgi:hypothetical protein